jgi:exosome complex component RRP4
MSDLEIYQPRKRTTLKSIYQNSQLVVPGETICEALGYLPGHGTYVDKGNLVASIAGVVERINKLICVKPLMTRYTGDVGDVIIGRIIAVGQERWRIDINAKQDGVLLLSSINLPGGVRRRRTTEDQLKMRDFFVENDVIS